MIAPLAALLRLHEINMESVRNGGNAVDRREVSRLLQAITPEMYEQYKRLYRKFGGDAVAPLGRGACMGCHTVQPARLEKAGEHIYVCDNCGRFVYEPHVAYDMYVG